MKNKLILSTGTLGFVLGLLNCFFGILTFINPFAVYVSNSLTTLLFQEKPNIFIICLFVVVVNTLMFLILGYCLKMIENAKSWISKSIISTLISVIYIFLYFIGLEKVLLIIGV